MFVFVSTTSCYSESQFQHSLSRTEKVWSLFVKSISSSCPLKSLCFGLINALVSMSAYISSIGQYLTLICPLFPIEMFLEVNVFSF